MRDNGVDTIFVACCTLSHFYDLFCAEGNHKLIHSLFFIFVDDLKSTRKSTLFTITVLAPISEKSWVKLYGAL